VHFDPGQLLLDREYHLADVAHIALAPQGLELPPTTHTDLVADRRRRFLRRHFERLADQDLAALRELTAHPDDEIRGLAIHALGGKLDADDPATRDALLARADDPAYMTRIFAILGLSRRRDERVRPFLARSLAEPGRHQRAESILLERALDFLDFGPSPERLTAIRLVLLQMWDPIGVWYGDPCPAEDEYDFYIPQISAALESRRSEDEVAALLAGYRTGAMGLRPNPERDRAAAAHLIAWEQSHGRYE